jgi:hypothetical protein
MQTEFVPKALVPVRFALVYVEPSEKLTPTKREENSLNTLETTFYFHLHRRRADVAHRPSEPFLPFFFVENLSSRYSFQIDTAKSKVINLKDT